VSAVGAKTPGEALVCESILARFVRYAVKEV
jgi:hypothetical protein